MPTPTIRASLAVVLFSAVARAAFAQTGGSVADSSHFRPLNLPTPNEYRTGSGRPGSKYWQQRVDYRITAELDEGKNELRGRETIHYSNRSPDTLTYLWLQVEQNICEPTSVTNQLNQPRSGMGSSPSSVRSMTRPPTASTSAIYGSINGTS